MRHGWEYGGYTHIGHVRPRNEDEYGIDGPRGVLAVADGMGGQPAAAVAARLAVETALRILGDCGGEEDPDSVLRSLGEAVVEANRAVLVHAAKEPATRGMGTTLVVARIAGDVLCVAHAGDSRLYAASPEGVLYATRDHSVVRELLDQGAITPAEALVHPLRSVVTRAVGVAPALTPETGCFRLSPGARVLLFSDGLSKMLDDGRIVELLFAADDPTEIARRLVDAANAAGGVDNTTVVAALRRPE